jgi:hypothetical protein
VEETSENNNKKVLHKPHYEIRVSSQSYSNIAAVLAGFAFAAFILVVQTKVPAEIMYSEYFRDWATITFLLSLLGCVLSSFTFATVTGEEVLAPRSHTIALLSGISFSVAANLIFLGMAFLSRIYLSPNVYGFIHTVFPFIMLTSPLFIGFSAFDPIIGFEKKRLSRKDYSLVFVPSFLPLVIAIIIKFAFGCFQVVTIRNNFNLVMTIASIVIVIGSGIAVVVSSIAKTKFRLSLAISGILMALHSIVIGFLILML